MKLHISNLSPKVSESSLRELFARYGPVFRIEMEWQRIAGRNSGTAIVEMNIINAMTAARELTGRAFHNRRLYITLMGDDVVGSKDLTKPKAQAKSANGARPYQDE